MALVAGETDTRAGYCQEALVERAPRQSTAYDDAALVEAERRRLADSINDLIVEPLALLMAQTTAYERAFADMPAARRAYMTLGALTRQALQQSRDLAETLRPAILDELGLEPALDALAGQMSRCYGMRIDLHLARWPARLPASIERTVYRAVQLTLQDAAVAGHASLATLRLERTSTIVTLTIDDDGDPARSGAALAGSSRQMDRFGGNLARMSWHVGVRTTITMPLRSIEALTKRERAVLRLLAQGRTNRQIAAMLGVSPRTVGFHLENIFAKLSVNSRTEAALLATYYE